MLKTRLILPLLALLPAGAFAQIFQNADAYYMADPVFTRTQMIGNSGETLYGSFGYGWTWGIGKQIKRIGGATLWLDIPFTFDEPSHQTATIPGSITLSGSMVTPGVRLMSPLSSRFSVYVVGGGGGGFFSYPAVQTGILPLTSNEVSHGAVAFGGGVDFRLSRHFSLRLDVRDYVTGRNLDGVIGRNHPMPMLGIVFH
jgi:hypothetical protein